MEGMYPAMIFVVLALGAVWWVLRLRDELALKRAVERLEAHQIEQANRVITAMKGLAPAPARKKPARRHSDLPSDYPRDSEG